MSTPITLSHEIVVIPAVVTSSFTIEQTNDDLQNKRLNCTVVLSTNPVVKRLITVWKDAAYDTNFNWTQAQLETALKAILEA